MSKNTSSILYIFCIFVLLLAGMLLFLENSEAATYNFYFNNTEQGNNSLAKPSLVVTDPDKGQSNATSGMPINNSESNGTQQAPSTQEEPPDGSTTTDFSEPPRENFSRIRLLGGIATTESVYRPENRISQAFVSIKGTSSYYSDPEDEFKTQSYLVSASFFLSQHIGLSWLYGRIIGPELEFAVLRPNVGIQLSGMVGAFKDKNLKSFMESYYEHYSSLRIQKSNSYTAHLGALLGYNFTKNIGVLAAYRVGINATDDHYKTSTFNAGAAVYF